MEKPMITWKNCSFFSSHHRYFYRYHLFLLHPLLVLSLFFIYTSQTKITSRLNKSQRFLTILSSSIAFSLSHLHPHFLILNFYFLFKKITKLPQFSSVFPTLTSPKSIAYLPMSYAIYPCSQF